MSSDSFLSRWARRKADVAKAADPESVAAPPLADIANQEAEAEQNRVNAMIDALPKIDDLTAQSDFTAFLQKGVPDLLKNAAMRKLWISNPELGKWSDMAEYAWDWNTPGGAPGYGPLEADFDTEAMLERILPRQRAVDDQPQSVSLKEDSEPSEGVSETSGPPPHVAEDGQIAAAQQDGMSELPVPEVNTSRSLENTGNTDDEAFAAQQKVPALTNGSRRRHGGALPA
jgi:hypothetical protein